MENWGVFFTKKISSKATMDSTKPYSEWKKYALKVSYQDP